MCNYFADCDCFDHYDEAPANYHIVSPAYGRDYKDEVSARNDWDSGKDFVYESIGGGGRYCSKRDFTNGDIIEIRYNKKVDLTVVHC